MAWVYRVSSWTATGLVYQLLNPRAKKLVNSCGQSCRAFRPIEGSISNQWVLVMSLAVGFKGIFLFCKCSSHRYLHDCLISKFLLNCHLFLMAILCENCNMTPFTPFTLLTFYATLFPLFFHSTFYLLMYCIFYFFILFILKLFVSMISSKEQGLFFFQR